ncbi:MAG TPA: ABC transporter ATP-binding protein [Stellaceae bacterium]|nr:ABC transporter ATP-binding protein [Stellaceae bacterium]
MRSFSSSPAQNSAGSNTPSSALSIERVTKRYGTIVALDDVSLQVERGRFVTLLGPSGSGKTTLLMIIAGFVSPTEGSIRIDGNSINSLPPERRNFGMVFQGYALFPHMTVAENVAFALKVRRRPRAEIADAVSRALSMVQLERFADRLPRQLSGGQQQRAALARALIFQPKLLLLDEPLSALDKNLRSDLQMELRDLHQRLGLTFIYVTHDQQEALSMSDEIAILRDGRLIQKGTPAMLYENPMSRFVAGFLGRSNFLSGTVESATADAFSYRCGNFLLRQMRPGDAVIRGNSVLIALRPEKIHLLTGAADESADNRLVGRVSAFNYLGGVYHLVVTVEGVGQIMVDTPTWRQEVPTVGKEIMLGWEADASISLSED